MPEPFTIAVPDAELDDLAARIRATRWPSRETVDDWSQGVPLAVLRDLAAHWVDGYDWRDLERRVNAVPQVRIEVGGVDIHALHARSRRSHAVPLVLTHGWPGGVPEFLRVLPLLTDPPAGEPAFDVVIPSLPGYGWSGTPVEPGWGIERIADAWAELMTALGYDRFVASGGDWGTSVSTMLGIRHPARILGLHLTPPLVAPDPATLGALTDDERAAIAALDDRSGSAYGDLHATRPQTIGYALADSPVGLAAWMVEKLVAWSDRGGSADPFAALSRDDMLDLVSWYWFSGTAASSIRLYWESIRTVESWFRDGAADHVDVPVGAAVFRDLPRPSRRWAARRFRDIRYWSEPDRGGHFAAFEQPDRFARELRASVASFGAFR